MKKKLPSVLCQVFLMLLIVLGTFAPTTVFADAAAEGKIGAASGQASSAQAALDAAKAALAKDPTNPTLQKAVADAQQALTSSQQQVVKAADGPPASTGGGCGVSAALFDPSSIPNCLLKGVATGILTFTNLLLYVAGTVLNWIIVKTVFDFGNLMGNSPGLLLVWGILRDLGNMLLLFGFIFMGLATILDIHSYSARKAIPQLLIFAVLLNFSLFAAEAVIDTANAFTSAIYSQAEDQSTNSAQCGGIFSGDAGGGGQTDECAKNYGIAGHIMQSTGLSSMWEIDVNSSATSATAAALLGLCVFAAVGAVVLFAAAIMLTLRFIVLTALMVTSPIGFAGMAIPAFQGYAKQWWNKLIHQAFYAPIMFMAILISLKVTDSFANASTRGSLAAAITNNTTTASAMGIVMIFVIIIGFMIGSLIIAQRFGAAGASFSVNMATRTLYGGSARLTNGVVGGAAFGARKWQQSRPNAANSKVGKFVNKYALTPMAGANFDMRRAPGAGKLLTVMGAGDAAKAGEHASFEDMRHGYHEARDSWGKAGDKREKEYQDRVNMQAIEDQAHHGALDEEASKNLRKLSVDKLKELHGIKEGVAALAEHLSPEQFDKLMNDKDMSEKAKKGLRDGRYASLNEKVKSIDGLSTELEAAEKAVKADPSNTSLIAARDAKKKQKEAAEGAVKSLREKEYTHLIKSDAGAELIANDRFASLLSDDQFKKFKTNDELSAGQIQTFEAARNKMNDPDKVAARMGGMTKAEDLNKISGTTLTSAKVLNAMNGRQIGMIDTDNLSVDDYNRLDWYVKHLKSAGNPKWTEFQRYASGNTKAERRWSHVGL